MMNIFKRITLLAALFVLIGVPVYAEGATEVEKAVANIIQKYQNTEGVTCLTVAKGSGLDMLKMLLKKEFGRTFMKGVKSISIIDYSSASAEICSSLRKEMDVFISILEEFKLDDNKDFSDNDFIRCFAASKKEGTLSDFVIALEDEGTKTLIYMAGEITAEL